LRSHLYSRLAHYIIIATLVVIAYVPIFTGDFVFDDLTLIRDNPYITRLQSLSSYLAQEDGIVDDVNKGVFHTGYYRPLVNITYFIDYKIWGMKAYGFRATNLILHLLACFLLYELLLQFACRRWEVFWAVLLFAIHPLHTEAVTVITSRNNILATIFILASFYAYCIWWQKGTPFALAVSLLAFAGAVFSKEFGLMALPVFFLYQRLLAEKKNLRSEMESYLPYLVILIIYLALRKTVVPPPLNIPDDILMRIAYLPYLFASNLKLIFLPSNLHSFSVLYPGSLLAPTVIGSFFLVLFIIIFLYVLRRDSLVVFSTAAFFVTLLPVLNIINKPSVSLIAMRWLYLPVAFLAFGFARMLMKAKLEVVRGRGAKLIILLAVAIYFAAGSYTLNAHLWHDQETFLTQEVLHFNNERCMGDYAEMMLKKKQYREAEYFFQLSLKKTHPIARDLINYGALLIETSRPQGALNLLEKARPLAMDNKERGDWNNNMGAALTLAGNYGRAHEYFSNALALNPQDSALHRNLAYLLFQEGRTREATQHLKISEQIKCAP
jgi:protein O-mannosyl-transferase